VCFPVCGGAEELGERSVDDEKQGGKVERGPLNSLNQGQRKYRGAGTLSKENMPDACSSGKEKGNRGRAMGNGRGTCLS